MLTVVASGIRKRTGDTTIMKLNVAALRDQGRIVERPVARRSDGAVTTRDPFRVKVNCPHCFATFRIMSSARLKGMISHRFECDVCHMRGPSFSQTVHGWPESGREALRAFRSLVSALDRGARGERRAACAEGATMSTAAERLRSRRFLASEPIPEDLREDTAELLADYKNMSDIAGASAQLWYDQQKARGGCVLVPVPLLRRLHAEAVESRDCHLESCARLLPDGTADLNSLDPEERETHDELDGVIRQAEALLPPEHPDDGGTP
jgi:hypothetical protein